MGILNAKALKDWIKQNFQVKGNYAAVEGDIELTICHDENGNIGYKEAGADTVMPFS